MKSKVFILVLTIEICYIFFLLVSYYKKPGEISSFPSDWFSRNKLAFVKNKNISYYFEPIPNSEAKISLGFLGENYDYSVVYIHNQDSLRQKENIPVIPPHDTYRIIAIGDSFTYGSYLNNEDTYPSQLEKILNQSLECIDIKKFEVLNLGVNAYDIPYVIERFRVRGQKYDPDLVLWLIIDDDFTRINELTLPKAIQLSEEINGKKEYTTEEKKLIYYDQYKKAKDEIIKNEGRGKILSMQSKSLYILNEHFDKDLIMFTFPFMKTENKKIIHDFINSGKKKHFYDGLTNIYDRNEFFPDGHPNEKGANMIAKDLMEYLLEKQIVSCTKI